MQTRALNSRLMKATLREPTCKQQRLGFLVMGSVDFLSSSLSVSYFIARTVFFRLLAVCCFAWLCGAKGNDDTLSA